MHQMTLWHCSDATEPKYPERPGCKEKGGTSELAAEEIASVAGRLRAGVIETLRVLGSATPDEIADYMHEGILSIRPRCSELISLGVVRKSDERRRNPSGKLATVLVLTSE